MTCSNFCAILFPVSERKTMNLFKKNQMTLKEIDRFMDAKRKREGQMREWKIIPESERPTWEQFKRGLKVIKKG